MASRTTTTFFPPPSAPTFVNNRACAQVRAWKTYHDLQETTTDAADANESSEDFRKALENSARSTGKRQRESGSSEVLKRPAARLTQDEIRLTQTEARNPSDATPILVPSNDDGPRDNDWNPHRRSEMVGLKRGFRPSNTLDQPTAQSANKSSTFWTPHATGHKALPTQTVKGGNVRRGEETRFDTHQAAEHPSKKQKPNSPARSSCQISPQPIDLTDEVSIDVDADANVFSGIPRPRNRKESADTQSTKMGRTANNDDPFLVNESMRAASFTHDPKQSKSAKRRNGNDPRHGSQRSSNYGSAQSPPVEIQDDSVEELGVSRNSPMVIVDSQDGTHTSHSRSTRLPPIDLGKGLPESKSDLRKARSKTHRGSDQDVHNSNNVLSGMRHTNQPPKLPQRGQHQGVPKSVNLRDSFRRDDHNPGHPIKAKDRMRTESRDAASSPDELGGDRTIPHHSSPLKGSIAKLHSSSKGQGYHKQQQSSPVSVYQRPVERDESSEPATDDATEAGCIPIRSIFSKQCVQDQGNLALVWDSEEDQFFVACEGQKVRLPDQNALVTIGKHDVSVSWQHNRDLAKAILKGSSNGFSNGTVIIDFMDAHGLSVCYNYLMHATGDTMKSVPVNAEHLEKCFVQQRKTLQEAYHRVWQALTAGPTIVSGDRRAGWQAVQNQSEEEIQYEVEDDTGTLREVVGRKQKGRADGESSHYFTQDTTRRSTRQARPTAAKPRSPTPPPRWSEMNPPVKWQQPVVYPSQGARRVTVYDSDISRLDEGEFLNDNILGFAIRHIEESMTPAHKSKVHFFNTFFYSTLMRNKSKMDYEAVKRWTKNIDIFTVPYTIVPINNNLHWYFAIICNMQFLDRKLSGINDAGDENSQDATEEGSSSIMDAEGDFNEVVPPRSADASGRVFYDGDRDVFEFTEDGQIAPAAGTTAPSRSSAAGGKKKKNKNKKPAPTKKYDTTAPVIIMLDSFAHQRSAESTTLKKYIQAEAREKRAMEVDIGQIQGINAKGLPEQPNFCDCGVFVIGYLAEFAKDPDTFVKKLLRREMDADKDFKNFNAPAMRTRIRETLMRVSREQDEERKMHKAQKKAKAAQAGTPTNVSKQASPVRQLQTAKDSSSATMRSTSEPAQPVTKPLQSCAFSTSQTAPHERSSPAQDTLDKAEDDDDDELEVSPPTGLTQADGILRAYESASSSSSKSDEEMLDVGDGPETSRAGSATGREIRNTGAEIADSQGKGYD